MALFESCRSFFDRKFDLNERRASWQPEPMPRANRYFVAGKVYHLTHRCHHRDFLFRFARDRSAYRQLLWKTLREFPVSVLGYSITSHHTHLIVRSELSDAVSAWMQQLEGQFAQAYNRRKGRSAAFWEDRYHCTMVDRGMHLWNCIVFVEPSIEGLNLNAESGLKNWA